MRMQARRARPRIVYLNGRFLPVTKARVSVEDRGLLYGDGLFETVRVYRGMPFALDRHLARLEASARCIGFEPTWSLARLESACRHLLEHNDLSGRDCAIRITVTRGSGGDGLVAPDRPRPTVLITTRSLAPGLAELQKRGVKVTLLSFHRGADVFPAGAKTINYLPAVVGKTEARRRGAFEGIYCSPRGGLLEGTTSNLFIIKGRKLLTPPAGRDVLAGITRSIVLRTAPEAGLSAAERHLYMKDLEEAEEAFLTSSTIEVMPIRMVESRPLSLSVGPKTRSIQAVFAKVVQRFALMSAERHSPQSAEA